MRVNEIINFDAEKTAADNMKQNAKRMQKQASAMAARTKIKTAQQQLVKAVQPVKPIKPQ